MLVEDIFIVWLPVDVISLGLYTALSISINLSYDSNSSNWVVSLKLSNCLIVAKEGV